MENDDNFNINPIDNPSIIRQGDQARRKMLED